MQKQSKAPAFLQDVIGRWFWDDRWWSKQDLERARQEGRVK